MNGWYYIVIGIFLAGFSLYVEWRHKVIWERSKRVYRESESRLVNFLLRPSYTSYVANVFIVWPLVLVLGLLSLIYGIRGVL